jgi:hypothetical protein
VSIGFLLFLHFVLEIFLKRERGPGELSLHGPLHHLVVLALQSQGGVDARVEVVSVVLEPIQVDSPLVQVRKNHDLLRTFHHQIAGEIDETVILNRVERGP